MQTVPSMFVVSGMQQLAGPFITRRGQRPCQGAKSLEGWLHFTPYADE